MSKQPYFCEACDYSGSVPLKPHEDVMSVIQKMTDDHKRHSPECKQSPMKLRIGERAQPDREKGSSHGTSAK